MMPKLLLAKWTAWEEKFNAISQRERLMVSAAVVVGVVMLGGTLFVEPAFLKNKQANKTVVQQSEDLAKLRLQLLDLQEKLKFDPNAAKRVELARLEAKLKEHKATLNSDTGALVPPGSMNVMLERLLGRQPGLRLLSLRSLAPTSLLAPAGEKKDSAGVAVKPKADLFRHGVEIKVAGSYSELYQYLTQLESEGQKLLWGEVKLVVTEYPTAVLTLVVYTLSAEQAWLSI
jgi:MSHA biogenesis protein MshJ